MRIQSIPRRPAWLPSAGGFRRVAGLAALLLCATAAAPGPASAQADIVMCTGQPVPPGYVVVGAGNGQQCPGFYGPNYNQLMVRLPGEEVTVCSALTPEMPGYVLTGRGNHQACPGFYGPRTNTATWRRLPQAPAPSPPPSSPADPPELERLDEYGRYVAARLRGAEGRLRVGQPTHQAWVDALAQGAAERVTLEMEVGVPHTLVAVCDQDCGEMELRVIDPNGATAAAGEPGIQSVVRLTPGMPGRWTVEASMRRCGAQFCRFAVGLYETPPDAGVPPRRRPVRP